MMYDSPTIVVGKTQYVQDPKLGLGYFLSSANAIASLSRGLSCVEFRGAARVGERLVNTREQFQSVLDDTPGIEAFISCIGHHTSGSYTCVVFDSETGSTYFLNDPLGGGMIFQYADHNMLSLSTDIMALRSTVNEWDGKLTRNVLYELSGFATGTQCHAGDTPFAEIEVVEPGFGVRIDRDGSHSIIDYGINGFMFAENELSYDELIEVGIDNICQTIRAAVEAKPDLVLADVSGGFDSRLVLAAIANLGVTSDIVLRSIKKSPEWGYALGLANAYRMRITEFRGFDQVVGRTDSFYELCVGGARSSGGVINNDVAKNSLPAHRVKLQGGYGEVIRTFNNIFYSEASFDPKVLGERIWSWARLYRLNVDNTQVFNVNQVLDSLSASMIRFSNRAERYSVENHNMSSFWYQQGRNRYWIGQQSYHASRVQAQLDPLYSPALIAAAYTLSFWERKSNLVGLESMLRLDRRLLEYPYYNKGVVTDRFLSKNAFVGSREFPNEGGELVSFDKRFVGSFVPHNSVDEVASVDREAAKRLGVSATVAYGVRTWGAEACEALIEHPVLREMFNIEALPGLFRCPESSRTNVLAAADLIGMLFRCGLLSSDGMSVMDRHIFLGS